jgi:integrase
LSRVFQSLNALSPLPYGDPFDRRRVQRRKKSEIDTASHQPLEPDTLAKVIAEAVADGKDYRDLFIVGAQTGMRLKDAALLKWSSIKGNFIEIKPHKTIRSGNTARIPTSPTLRKLLDNRKQTATDSKYVIPGVAEHYIRNSDYVTKRCKRIFEQALGKAATIIAAGKHRKNNTAIYSFHSFRTTFMSLLASKDVSTRDAMRMMGWESPEMIRIYEKMLEKARGDSDRRAQELVDSLDELKFDIPECVAAERKLVPTEDALRELVDKYSNITIGKIYNNISEAAVRKALRKFGIERTKRIESADVTDKDIEKIRKALKEA